jgi:PAS domain S-box-containing protein
MGVALQAHWSSAKADVRYWAKMPGEEITELQKEMVLLTKDGDTGEEIAKKLDLSLKELGEEWLQLEAALKVVTQEESVKIVLARLLATARKALVAEDAHFAMIIGSSKEQAVLTFNSAGVVTGVSHDSEKLLGVPAGKLIGKTIDSILVGKAAGADQSADEMLRAETEGTVESDRTHMRLGGDEFLAHHTLVALIGPTGDNTGFVRTIRDLKWRRVHEIKVAELEQTIALLIE